jgi:sugar O-acyltransferase (sialic acid O-acetyltransferase NeuD family)
MLDDSEDETETNEIIMTPSPIICWGAKGQAKVLREFLPAMGFDLIACFDNSPSIESPFAEVPLIGGWSAFDAWRAKHPGPIACVVTIGGENGVERLNVQKRLAAAGLQPVSLSHPTAFVAANATIGIGSQVLAMSAVCVDVILGEACIINTRASVDHECTVGDAVHIGPGAILCGEVQVEDFAFVGAGATILPRVRIGRKSIIGAGAVVSRDVPSGSCVVGVPARVKARIAAS